MTKNKNTPRKRCDVCGEDKETIDMKSVFGDIYYSVCEDCKDQGLEPYSIIMEAKIKYGLESYSPAVQAFAENALTVLEKRIVQEINEQ